MRALIVAVVVALTVVATAASADRPRYLLHPTSLPKFETAARGFMRTWFGVTLAPGRCVPKGRDVDTKGRTGYRRVECEWRGGWFMTVSLNFRTGKTFALACRPNGDCDRIKM